jgi:ACT domain-containing protein
MKECNSIKEKILQSLRETGIISIACSQAGISRYTFYRWKKVMIIFQIK